MELFITTLMSIFAGAITAFLTVRVQTKRSLMSQKRLCKINSDTVIELFRAQIAGLMFFLPEGNPDFRKDNLSLYCRKLSLIESYLADLTDSDLPDDFIPRFQYFRLMTSLTRITIEHRMENCPSNILPLNSFEDLNIADLIHDINTFIAANQKT